MGLTITKLTAKGQPMAKQIVKERLYLTADGKRVVGEGDADAASLFAATGKPISEADARRFGIVDGRIAPPEEKAAKGTADKARKGTADKGAKGG